MAASPIAIDATVMRSENGIASTSDGQGREPSAHVSTNGGHAIDAAVTRSEHFAQINGGQGTVMHSRERDAPTPPTSELEPSAHVSTRGSPSTSKPSRFEQERVRTQARMALVALGYKSREAGKAVDLAIRYGHDTLESVIREALRSCVRAQ